MLRMINLPKESTTTEVKMKKVATTREAVAVEVSEAAEAVAVATEVVLTDHKLIEATEEIETMSHTMMTTMMDTTTVNQFTTSPREEATRRKT